MKIAIAFVADSKTKYLYQSLRLLVSINSMPSVHSVSAFVGVFPGAPGYFIDEFARLGATVLRLDRYSEIHGPSNKMAVLRHEALEAFDFVVMCDCDVIFTKSLDTLFESDGIRAKIADLKTLPDHILAELFDLAKIPFPNAEYVTSVDRKESILYCNTGVVVFSSSVFSAFVKRWLFWNDFVLTNIGVLGDHNFFADQASFALTLSEFGNQFIELGSEMNFPTHIPIDEYPDEMRTVVPAVIHYHDSVWGDSGELRDFPATAVADAIRGFNLAFTADPRLTAGPVFWDFYYSETDDDRDVSRTESYRRAIAREVCNALRPASVLDIGCGRGRLRGVAEDAVYCGVDSSAEAVSLASRLDPAGDYRLLDIAIETPPSAELVVLNGVLPYLPTERDVRAAVANAAAAAERAILLSALVKPVETWDRPKTFFTVNLDALLEDRPDFRFTRLGHCGAEGFYLGVRRQA